ncbi:MAG: pilus assembly protein PilM [Hydrogenibacillus schlegelii]|uniref:Pilus assembly protein PilM n=1 Tax=Hydrogenibacillus schlegelii TaxID=1484 RepID=A0A947G8W3_HYDSH|nr:pilus assembly protein PilM [Hydrogenibacillus schlegelii]
MTGWGRFPALGMQIGEAAVRIVRLKRGTGPEGPLPPAWAEVPLPPGAVGEERIVRPRDLYEALRDWRTSAGIIGGRVVIGLPPGHVISRMVAVPRLSRRELQAYLETEQAMGRLIPLSDPLFWLDPYDPDDGRQGEDGRRRMVVTAVEQRTVQAVHDVLTALGFFVRRIAPPGPGVGALLCRMGSTLDDAAALWRQPDAGEGEALDVFLFSRGVPVFYRRMLIGGGADADAALLPLVERLERFYRTTLLDPATRVEGFREIWYFDRTPVGETWVSALSAAFPEAKVVPLAEQLPELPPGAWWAWAIGAATERCRNRRTSERQRPTWRIRVKRKRGGDR